MNRVFIRCPLPIDSDTPFSLALAALPSIPILTDTEKTGFDFTLYTGDLVAHDPDNQLSRDYVTYSEVGTSMLSSTQW